MIISVLLDSDVIIEFLRGNSGVKRSLMNLFAEGTRVCFCPVSSAEVHAGMRPAEEAQINALFSTLDCLPIDEQTGIKAGNYLRTFARSHHVELGDALIAATAAANDATLWTRNRKHYPMPEVRLFE